MHTCAHTGAHLPTSTPAPRAHVHEPSAPGGTQGPRPHVCAHRNPLPEARACTYLHCTCTLTHMGLEKPKEEKCGSPAVPPPRESPAQRVWQPWRGAETGAVGSHPPHPLPDQVFATSSRIPFTPPPLLRLLRPHLPAAGSADMALGTNGRSSPHCPPHCHPGVAALCVSLEAWARLGSGSQVFTTPPPVTFILTWSGHLGTVGAPGSGHYHCTPATGLAHLWASAHPSNEMLRTSGLAL